MKKCLIIYYSYHHGNTEKIASAMAKTCGAELCTIDELDGKDLDDYKIMGFGSGIAYGKHYAKLLEAVKKLNLRGKSVFVFSTSGSGNGNYNTELTGILTNMGADILGRFACKGYDTAGPFKLIGGISKGHPDAQDIDAAKKFIFKVAG